MAAFKASMEDLDEQFSLHGSVALAVNLDGNPVTQVLVSFLAPDHVAGISFDHSRRRLLSVGEQPEQSFLQDPGWDSSGFVDRYQGVFKSNYIAELFAVLAGVNGYCDPTNINLPSVPPPFSVPDVLIHCTTTRGAKIWPFHHWKSVLDALFQRELSVGLVGSAPKCQQDSYSSE